MRLLIFFLAGSAAWAQSSGEAIRAVLEAQVTDWNRGDVKAFMRAYDRSESTLFVSSRVVRGYERVLENYLARYDNREKMGRLTFSNLEVRELGPDYALVLGNFNLIRSPEAGGNSAGIFTLTFHKQQGGWKIIADHTSETTAAAK